jgi:hypothetical protein
MRLTSYKGQIILIDKVIKVAVDFAGLVRLNVKDIKISKTKYVSDKFVSYYKK